MSNPTNSIDSSFALDARALSDLKRSARDNPDQSLKKVASQFESVFMNMMLKSMRDTVGQDGAMDSDASRAYTGMLDQQLAQALSSNASAGGLGLADMIVKQLSRNMGKAPGLGGAGAAGVNGAAGANGAAKQNANSGVRAALEKLQTNVKTATSADTSPQAESFVATMLPAARAAEAATGVPARFVLAQAALESGWGKSEVRGADGTASHNLFGLKAGRDWKGPTVQAVTTEYVNGVPQKVVQRFRAYDSYADSFSDYAKLLTGSARYKNVLAQGQDAGGFASALQRAGYATDPRYAEKIARIIHGGSMRGVA
ncbi:MAG TPA: flagellar assembly peptidoglycan hydrolase FlgJ [Burkholderiales bacterium]|nr:flagellar assembly peptidoglycan hydrolase FlgJ [Burkholderiales bacterium]